jgi:hypothetical protein
MFFPVFRQTLKVQGLHIIEASRSQADAPYPVRLPWTSNQPETENSTWQYTTLSREKTSVPPAGFQPAIPASERPHTHALERAAIGIGLRDNGERKMWYACRSTYCNCIEPCGNKALRRSIIQMTEKPSHVQQIST